MSYRSIKRTLGESHLERKLLVAFGISLFLLIGSAFWLYSYRTDQMLEMQNEATGRRLADVSWTTVHWEEINYAGQLLDKEGKDKDWVEFLKKLRLQGRDYNFEFLRPADTDNAAPPSDPYDAELLEKFAEEPAEDDPPGKGEPINNGEQYVYYRPFYAQAYCINCHKVATGPPDLAEGQLMAVAKVTISNAATRSEQTWNKALLAALAIIISFLAIVAAKLIVRYVVVKPLKHLRDVSDEVSRGNLEQRAEIHTDDEFEVLAVAFNRMLASLVTAQEELRRLNVDLDLKVDELAQANMRLFELNRLKSDFLATMSHELRTPLNSIIGFSDVLSSIKSLDDRQRRYVQNIQKSGKMLLDMINDILDLAKIESGKMELRPAYFRIEQVIDAQFDMARPLAERKNLDLNIEVEPELPQLYQDQGKVQQILNNLLSNAIKFTPDGGRIVVAARRGPNDDQVLTVADTGVGISEADQLQIFEKFRQGRTVMPGGDAMTREYEGTGLGLSIVKELCKLLGGDISVDSELGKGSTFTVRLPWRVVDSMASDDRDRLTDETIADGDHAGRDDFLAPTVEATSGEPLPS
jgi:two-component system, NarL family, sensor histidine kinase BarA